MSEGELAWRLIASVAGLPRLCNLKRCRRRKRCFGGLGKGEIPCIDQHKGLLRDRYAQALKRLGWRHPRSAAALNEDVRVPSRRAKPRRA